MNPLGHAVFRDREVFRFEIGDSLSLLVFDDYVKTYKVGINFDYIVVSAFLWLFLLLGLSGQYQDTKHCSNQHGLTNLHNLFPKDKLKLNRTLDIASGTE